MAHHVAGGVRTEDGVGAIRRGSVNLRAGGVALQTVVAGELLADLAPIDTMDDERTVADLLVDQVEFADRIYVTKTDLVTADRLATTISLVKRLNPRASVDIMVNGRAHGRSVIEDILGARLFSEATARSSEGYTEELANPHTPETEEYGISSVLFRGARPLHRGRLLEALRSTRGLVRSKGYCWIADRLEYAQVWHQAGPDLSIRPASTWQATGLEPGNEIVLIGVKMDGPTLLAKLDDAMIQTPRPIVWCSRYPSEHRVGDTTTCARNRRSVLLQQVDELQYALAHQLELRCPVQVAI